jgi:hypothetical protein
LDKIPGPDGWTVEFYLHYFDLVGTKLLELVEDSKLHGKVTRAINSTFFTLIPKENHPATFDDYRPIALCNLCYKLISKIIANRIKHILSRSLSAEQLGFLKGRQILDVVGSTQECLHNIKKKNSPALILKLDLKKSFRLHRLGLPQTDFNPVWIQPKHFKMDNELRHQCKFCSAHKWRTLYFLPQWQRPRQGCPLSLLLFILVMEGLSLLLKKIQAEGRITGIKVSRLVKILHLLFVDDVLIMTNASLLEWREISRLLKIFSPLNSTPTPPFIG